MTKELTPEELSELIDQTENDPIIDRRLILKCINQLEANKKKLAKYEALEAAAKAFINCDAHDGKSCGERFDTLESEVCKLDNLDD